MFQSSSELELGVVYPGTVGRSGQLRLICEVNLDFNASGDGAKVMFWGMMFQSFGPMIELS